MKILWLSHFVPYPPAGGALQRSFHLLRSAAEKHEVHLLALNQPRLLPTARELGESESALASICASVNTFPIPAERSIGHRAMAAAMSVCGRDPFDVTWLRSGDFASAVDAQKASRFDLVHVDTIGLWPYVADWKNTPIVLGHHNIESDLILRRVGRETTAWRSVLFKRDAAKLRTLEHTAAEDAAMNLVVSELDGKRLRELAPAASFGVVDNGVDTDYWRPTTSQGEGIIFAGTLGWYPNRDAVEFLLSDIWPALLAQQAKRRLVLVGRDPPAVAVAAAAADPRIQVTGFVPDVRPFMQSASISVCPIRVGGGTRLKILDALAMGKPLVSTAIGVEGLDLTEGEHYLRAETGSDFVAQIQRLEQDVALSTALGAAGRQRVIDRYDWRVIGRQLGAAYARALVA